MSTQPTPAAGESTHTKAFFATGKDNKERVALFVDEKNPEWNAGRPALWGTIDGKRVSAFVQPGGEKDGKAYGPFLTISERGAKQEDGTYAKDVNIGRGNVVVTAEGKARLAINIGEETIWATPLKTTSNELMAKAGLDLAKLAEVRAQVAADAANDNTNAKKAAPGM